MTDTHAPPALSPIPLPERLDFMASQDLAACLAADAGEATVLDASAVGFVGALSAEVLLRARLDCIAQGRDFTIVEPSAEFVRGLSDLGLSLHNFKAGERP